MAKLKKNVSFQLPNKIQLIKEDIKASNYEYFFSVNIFFSVSIF